VVVVRALATLLVAALMGAALAQGFTGTFSGDTSAGRVDVELRQSGASITGALVGQGARFDLEGTVDDDVAYGTASWPQGSVLFEAYLQDDTLGFYLYEVDAAGAVVASSVIELILTRQGASAPPPPAPGGGAPNPFGAAPGARDPFAPQPVADPLVGIFADERITLEVRAVPGGYEAEIRANEQVFPLQLTPAREGLAGSFRNGADTFAFTARLEGEMMLFVTEGLTYRLIRRTPAAPRDPFGAAPGAAPQPGRAAADGVARGAIIARSGQAVLYEDDALAFIELLEFVMAEIGTPYTFSASERRDLLSEFARTFPIVGDADRAVLGNAREISLRVQSSWAGADQRSRREVLLGVLLVAFGAETVGGWLAAAGGGGGGGGAGSCGGIDDCINRFVDERTWTDTFNAQGCWAAAGCESYDSSTGEITFGSYD
jgi:hypothetical protein